MATFYLCEFHDYNTFIFKLYSYYVQPLYIHIMFKKYQLYPLETKK